MGEIRECSKFPYSTLSQIRKNSLIWSLLFEVTTMNKSCIVPAIEIHVNCTNVSRAARFRTLVIQAQRIMLREVFMFQLQLTRFESEIVLVNRLNSFSQTMVIIVLFS